MQPLHLSHIHAPKGPNLFAISVGAIFWFSIALLFFLISWAVGGDGFKASIGGNISLADYSGAIVGQASSQASVATTNLQLQTDLQSATSLKQSQLSGVNLDEEMSQLLIYQRSYAASAKVISTTQQLFDVLNNIIH